ncbi:MAG: phage tail protein [Desulfovibrio sp.]
MSLRFIADASDLIALRPHLAKVVSDLPAAAARALNKTIKGLRTEVDAEVRARYAVKKKDVFSTMSVIKAHKRNPEARLRIKTARSIPLFRFAATPKEPREERPKKGVSGVSVRVLVSGGRKKLHKVFVAKMSSGHVGIFERTSKKSLPIHELYGPTFLPYLQRDAVDERITDRANERLWKNLEHEADRELKKAGLR